MLLTQKTTALSRVLSICMLFVLLACSTKAQQDQWVSYKGGEGPGKGKKIVLVSGDEEYRSEEALTMMGKILAKKYGFDCTVLFAIDPKTGAIDAMNQTNIPGLENLKNADLMVIAARFRELPDEQMQHVDAYIKSGKPVVGLRTATHAFFYSRNKDSKYAKYDWRSKVQGWERGFGGTVLGETWVDHHGHHGKEGTRALIDGVQKRAKNPILNGVMDIWVPTDVYTINKLPDNSTILAYGLSTAGMTADAPANLEKTVMPIAWTRTYKSESGKEGRVFATTMGASIDLVSEDLRRMLVNGCLWALNMEDRIPEKADVGTIGEYTPTMFSPDLFRQGTFPSKYKLD